jgi:hypothetical protein
MEGRTPHADAAVDGHADAVHAVKALAAVTGDAQLKQGLGVVDAGECCPGRSGETGEEQKPSAEVGRSHAGDWAGNHLEVSPTRGIWSAMPPTGAASRLPNGKGMDSVPSRCLRLLKPW